MKQLNGTAAKGKLSPRVSRAKALAGGSEQFIMRSARLGRDFQIVVTLPLGLRLPGQRLPAIYTLDGGYGLAGPVARMLGSANGMAPAMIVAVDYPPGEANRRLTDLSHGQFTYDGQIEGGGGEAFQEFLLDELRAFIESNYPADPDRSILYGHSLGGLFATNVLALRPEAFIAYLIGSPSVWVDPSVLASVAKVAHQGAGRRVFVGVGGSETPRMLEGAANLASLLSAPSSKFVVRSQVFEGQDHMPYYAQMTPLAFAFCLPPKPAPPDRVAAPQPASALTRYVGVYRLADRRRLAIARREDSLLFQLDDQPPEEIFGIAADRFFFRGEDAEITFNDKLSGRTSLTLRVGDLTATAYRIR